MNSVRFLMLGGFLGAGKTTALGWLARNYQSQGKRVGVITNDQANNLVDTQAFTAAGLAAAEIPGGCFCCRFDALLEAAGTLSANERPDVLLAEPVGSCTDLVATVVQPLKRLYAGQYEVAPYVVLVDPARVRKILTGDRQGGFSPKVAYIFHKQLEEADAIAINKIDTLPEREREELASLIAKHFPRTAVLQVSARGGAGMAELARFVEQRGGFGRNIPEVDYNLYADGEAELGWLNSTATLSAEEPFRGDDLLLAYVAQLKEAIHCAGSEVAHVKAVLHACTHVAQVNLVASDAAPQLTRGMDASLTTATLILNARVHTDPERLWQVARECLERVCAAQGVRLTLDVVQRFRPGRPVPTHRYAEAFESERRALTR
jgi:G3E family GTPase